MPVIATDESPVTNRVGEALTAFSRRRRYLIGVSGGRDSIVLLDVLTALGFKRLLVCHLDHGLRGRESRADAAFVRRLAKRLGCEFEHARAKIAPGRGLESAAREARYAFFAKIARARRCREIFLGHHAGDRAETFLFNLLRGAGFSGLSGMRERSQREIDGVRLTILRPMLRVSRGEIDAHVAAHGLRYREDATNADARFQRNNFRHRIIPFLSEMFGRDVQPALVRAAEIAATEDDWLAAQLDPPAAELRVEQLRALHPALQRRTILAWLRNREIADAGFSEVEAVRALLTRRSPARVNLAKGRFARRRAGLIFIE